MRPIRQGEGERQIDAGTIFKNIICNQQRQYPRNSFFIREEILWRGKGTEKPKNLV